MKPFAVALKDDELKTGIAVNETIMLIPDASVEQQFRTTSMITVLMDDSNEIRHFGPAQLIHDGLIEESVSDDDDDDAVDEPSPVDTKESDLPADTIDVTPEEPAQ